MMPTARPWVDGLTIGQVLAHTAEHTRTATRWSFRMLGFRWTWREFRGRR